jgi:phenylacetate-coenzyme A ligase PaaK-like adenylate-forming protein
LDTYKGFERDLYSVNEKNFVDIAVQLFHFQVENNPIYRDYVKHLGIAPAGVSSLHDIPFLPISFFKSHNLKSGNWNPETVFTSSGTTGQQTSQHAVKSLDFYRHHTVRCFEHFFGDITHYHFLALLPSYLERTGSSLVAMIEYFIDKSRSQHSGFYLRNEQKLLDDVQRLRSDGKKTIVWGVTFALLDLAERYYPDLSHCIVFETGGMKGRRTELTRQELHSTLCEAFRVDKIFSEYGMTELLSQAYSGGKNAFFCPPWMRILSRDMTDPMEKGLLNTSGGINVVDLANADTVAFIETEDVGKVYDDGSFEILGRFDNSDVRGCNLMVE